MAARLGSCRCALLISAALIVAVALVVAAGVIPPVKADTFPDATPESAVPAFWANVLIGLLMAVILAVTAIRTSGRSRRSTVMLTVVAALVLILAFALNDAALAYKAEGPPMRSATTLLFLCAAVDLLAAVLIGASAFQLPKRA